jgi:hypothetical protein
MKGEKNNSFISSLRERGRDSSVGIATRYGLDGPGIESRWGARFSAPVQTGPGAHPASYTKGIGSFPGVERPGRGVDHPSHLVPRLKSRAIPLLLLWTFADCSRMNFTFYHPFVMSRGRNNIGQQNTKNILGWISRRWEVGMWTGLGWPRIGTGGGRL